MKTSLFKNLDGRISKMLDYPGCSKSEHNSRKTMWFSTFYGFIHVFVLTFAFLFFVPQLTILITYGFTALTILTTALILAPHLTRLFRPYFNIHLFLLEWVTYYTILRLGGIITSAGLIIACFSFVILTIPLQNLKLTLIHFIMYSAFVVIIGILGLYLPVPEQITPKINTIVWIINTLSMSAVSLLFVVDFFTQQQKFEQLEASKQKELSEAKTRLFTNITHEFRTPLTIIQGMAGLMEKEPGKYLTDGALKIRNNTGILLRLVNQMLDISKIEAGAMPVHNVHTDIINTLGYVTGLFNSLAQRKSITLQFSHKVASFTMDFDHDKLVQIISNLLSNAIKFTPEGGSIVLKANPVGQNQFFKIKVTDNGVGIATGHLEHVFDRFYQVENHASNGGGTGLGLALAKELTEMMNGTISVENNVGPGTTFTIILPITHNAITETIDRHYADNTANVTGSSGSTCLKPEVQHTPTNSNRPILLIVEDSDDVSSYLSAILQNDYQITRAGNGKEGLEKALNIIPDIVLSDVMMPVMDGIAMLEKLKADFRTSHIPVVMLTAKADIDSRLIGLERGADAYLAKPFNENELYVQLRSLIESRKKLHERYASLSQLPETNDPAIKTEDEFIIKVRLILEKNLANEDYNINDLCRELAVSHAQLYRKFKSISNQTIADYFKILRLLKAKELLLNHDMNITQIAFAVGFKNLSHFSREFTQKFGKNPKVLRKQ